MGDIFALMTPLFKLDNPIILKKITLILPPLMTNECKRSRNPLFNVFSKEIALNTEEYHHIGGSTKFG